MPIFEYECAKCKHVFEVLVSCGDPETTRCPSCSSKRITKLFSSFRIGSTGSGGNQSTASSACTTCTSNDCSSCG